MIQDIGPYVYHNEYKNRKAEACDTLLCYDGNKILVKEQDGEILFPTFAQAETWAKGLREKAIYLFRIEEINGQERFFYLVPGFCPEADGFAREDINIMRTAIPGRLAFAGVTGWQLNRFYDTRRFCSRCKTPLRHSEKERMLFCDSCHLAEYPKISPAVIVAVRSGNRLLLTKYAGREYTRYALVAGFHEIGETIEETVRREVMEEVGLKVKNLLYYKSQPWSLSDTLLMGFYCDVDGDDTICLDRQELSVGEWVERGDIPEYPVGSAEISLTGEMMMKFKRGQDPSA